MNYRHQFHAGNFADVMKHVLLLQLLRALQQKEKGFLYLDTHAGRGSYDLSSAAQGDSRSRTPEWPNGIGQVWTQTSLSAPLMEYVHLVRQFDRDRGNRDELPRFYPGSPWIARLLARPQDRLALCEKQPQEFTALSEEFRFSPRTTVQAIDGYVAVRAMLPPQERRALVLIDPSYEAQDEFSRVLGALREGLARLPGAVFALWYPLTERAGVGEFLSELKASGPPPTLLLSLMIASERGEGKLRGCGLVIINPPWKFEVAAEPLLQEMSGLLRQVAADGAEVRWLVPEK